MTFRSVDVRSDHVWLDFVHIDAIRSVGMRDRVQHLEQLERPIAMALQRRR